MSHRIASSEYVVTLRRQADWPRVFERIRVVAETEVVLIRTRLRELTERLDPEVFWQVHRGAIVNVHRIAKITREGIERHAIVLRGSSEKIGVSWHFLLVQADVA